MKALGSMVGRREGGRALSRELKEGGESRSVGFYTEKGSRRGRGTSRGEGEREKGSRVGVDGREGRTRARLKEEKGQASTKRRDQSEVFFFRGFSRS